VSLASRVSDLATAVATAVKADRARLTTIESATADTGWVILSAVSPYTKTGGYAKGRRIGKQVFVKFGVSKSTTTTIGSVGGVSAQALVQLPVDWKPAEDLYFYAWASRIAGAYLATADGIIRLNAGDGSGTSWTIAANQLIQGEIAYMVD